MAAVAVARSGGGGGGGDGVGDGAVVDVIGNYTAFYDLLGTRP